MKNLFKEQPSSKFIMPFGKYKGATLDEIASSFEGLLYLDWAAGNFTNSRVRLVIEKYLDDPVLQRDIEEAMDAQ